MCCSARWPARWPCHGDTQKFNSLYCSLQYRLYRRLEVSCHGSCRWQSQCRSEPQALKIPAVFVCGKSRALAYTTVQTRQCIFCTRVSGGALRRGPAAVSTMLQAGLCFGRQSAACSSSLMDDLSQPGDIAAPLQGMGQLHADQSVLTGDRPGTAINA